jgi:DNA processing protein
MLEMGAYEYLWLQEKSSFKRIADIFRQSPGSIPTDFVNIEVAQEYASKALTAIRESNIGPFGVRIHGASQYPKSLRDAVDPVELLYFQGAWELTESPKAIAIVGSRKPSKEGLSSAKQLVEQLVFHGYTIVSGLASGIDTMAHRTAIECGGNTIAVIGTPITEAYPKENRDLQALIASAHLLISQVPILRYMRQNWRTNRFFFPERNKTMSALSQATVIVEAGETSGTLVQARAAIQQGRKLFILDSCFQNPNITWPAKYEQKGAIRVRDMDDIKWGLDGI